MSQDTLYVVLQPHSNTNHSDLYRVVASHDWARYANGAAKYMPIAGEFESYQEANRFRESLDS